MRHRAGSGDPERILPRSLRRVLACGVALTAGCTAEDDPAQDELEVEIALARGISFERDVDGVSDGFDLDGAGDEAGCGVPDLVAPDGTPGIDNAFASLLPIVELAGGQAVEALVQATVNSGELLLAVEMLGWADAAEGDCIEAEVLRATGTPAIGGDGWILPGQTFDRHPELPGTPIACARVGRGGSVELSGFDFRLPLTVFDESIDLTMVDARMRLVPDGLGWTGVIGGGVPIAQIAENVLSFDGIPRGLAETVVGALEARADLVPVDGACTQMSVVLKLDLVSAWFFADGP